MTAFLARTREMAARRRGPFQPTRFTSELSGYAPASQTGVWHAIDGFIAKRFDMASELGAYLDPVADKALIVSIYIALAMVGAIPYWLVVLVVSRDLMIVSAVILSWVMAKPVVIAPFLVSKLNTAAQLAFAALMLGSRAFGVDPSARHSRCRLIAM
jgi:phosphatidylglycerophosphate synthase